MSDTTNIEEAHQTEECASSENLAIFGGSFDPIHVGHLRLLIDLQEKYHFDWVKLLPCGEPALKAHCESGAEDRLAMLDLAAQTLTPTLTAGTLTNNRALFKRFEIDDCELKRQGSTHTVDTLRKLRKELGPDLPITLILGMDSYLSFDKWHKPEEIRSLANLLVTGRPQYQHSIEETQNSDAESLTSTAAGLLHFHPTRQIDLSSSEIRNDIRNAKELKWLLPDSVWHYIKTNQLYGWPYSAESTAAPDNPIA